MQIRRSEAMVLLSITNPGNQLLEADWDVFELILFNFVQNAVKYNSKNGVFVVLADVKTNKSRVGCYETTNHFVEVQVIDTGAGIDKQRQNFLFKPFLELQQKQNMRLVKDNSIGLGLSCSKVLTNKLGGEVKLVQSQPRLTVFKFHIPVKCSANTQSLAVRCGTLASINELLSGTQPLLYDYLTRQGVCLVSLFDFSSDD